GSRRHRHRAREPAASPLRRGGRRQGHARADAHLPRPDRPDLHRSHRRRIGDRRDDRPPQDGPGRDRRTGRRRQLHGRSPLSGHGVHPRQRLAPHLPDRRRPASRHPDGGLGPRPAQARPRGVPVNWWCASSPKNWTWNWSPYLGALGIVFMVIGIGVWWPLRGRHTDPIVAARTDLGRTAPSSGNDVQTPIAGTRTGRTVAFVFGIIGLWAVLDWPLAALGAGYLAPAQMARQRDMVRVVADPQRVG